MRPLVAKLALLAFASAAVAACAKVVGIDDLAIGACKGGVCADDGGGPGVDPDDGAFDGGSDAPADRFEGPCPGKGPPAEWVGANDNRFCIDTTEVTVKDYRDLVTATDGGTNLKALGAIPAECQWKTTVAPAVGGPDDVPQTGVDWCDAYLYCRWAGKRLCGKSVGGKAAGSLSTNELPDFNSNQWLIACSLQGQLAYPYGSIRKAGACNLLDVDAGRALPVKQSTGCVGGYPGLYDMVGNVWEWIDACRPRDAGADVDAGDAGPAKAECVVKGGSFATNPPSAVTCRVDGTGGTRDLRVNDVGFRCCSP